jgi:predicted proteasome-type protease
MTYCVGLLVDTGLVMLSDSRTNAGVDQINTFRKMATFQRQNDRALVLLSAGNLAITQAVVNLFHEPPDLAIIRRDELKLATHISIDLDNEYFNMIRNRWGFALQEVFSTLPNPNW